MADQRSAWQAFDLDTGGGTDLVYGINLRLSASGGSIEAMGQKTMASSIPVTMASDQATHPVSIDEFPAAAAAADAFANPTTTNSLAMLMGYNGTTWDRIYAVADGAAVAAGTKGFLTLGTDGANYQVLSTNATGHVNIADGGNSITIDGSVSITGTVTVDSELPAAAALADATANPTVPGVGGFLMGYNGTTWDRVRTANTGRLQVDVVTGGGADTPTNPVTDYVTSASLAAGSEVNLDTVEAAAKKLRRVDVWATVAYRARVFLVNNAVEGAEPIAIGGAPAFGAWSYQTPHRNYAVLGTSAGADTFRVEVTNLDDNLAADVYATFAFED